MQEHLNNTTLRIYSETLAQISVARERGSEGLVEATLREGLLNLVFTPETAGRLDSLINQNTPDSLKAALEIVSQLQACLPNGGSKVPLTTSISPDPNTGEMNRQDRPSWDNEFQSNLGPDRVPLPLEQGKSSVNWSLQPHGRFTPILGPVEVNLADYKAAILDLDGFLVNSEKPILHCILRGARDLAREAISNPSYEFPPEIIEEIKQRAFGKDDKNMTVALQAVLRERGLFPEACSRMATEDFISHFRDMRAAYFEKLIASGEFKELAGAIDFVKALSIRLKGKVAIFTGSPERNADLEITALGLDEYLLKEFRVYTTSLPAGRGKPQADGFDMARNKLGLKDGDKWIAGGDRPNDSLAAIGSCDCGLFLAVPEDLDSSKFVEDVYKTLEGTLEKKIDDKERLRQNILTGRTGLFIIGGLGKDYVTLNAPDDPLIDLLA